MTMTETKLQNLNYDTQRRTGWYLSRLAALPSMRGHGAFNRVVRQNGYRCISCNVVNPHLSVDHIKPKSRYGTNDVDNLQLLCLEDHRKKDNKLKKVRKVKKRLRMERINSVCNIYRTILK
jgi:5-methylcytosine-specific restriction endonuclease McrA